MIDSDVFQQARGSLPAVGILLNMRITTASQKQGFGIWVRQYIFIERRNRIGAEEYLWPCLREALHVIRMCTYLCKLSLLLLVFHQCNKNKTPLLLRLLGIYVRPGDVQR